MFVHKIRGRGFGIGATAQIRVADELQVGIFRAQGVDIQRPAGKVVRSAVFIADFHVLEIKRGGMAHLRAARTPESVRRPVGKFHRVQRVLHPLIHPVQRNGFMMGHAHIDAEQRFGTQVLRQLQVFVETQAMRGIIAPDIPQRRARINVANGVFPMVHVRKIIALHPAAAGKAQKRRMQRSQRFGQIHAQAVIFPGLFREQRHHVQAQAALALAGNFQLGLRVGARGLQFQRVIFPVARGGRQFAGGQFLAIHAQQRHRQGTIEAGGGPGRQLQPVRFTGDYVHAPVTGVFHDERPVRFQQQTAAVEGIQRPALVNLGHRAADVPVRRLVRVFKRPVPHHFRVDAAVGG